MGTDRTFCRFNRSPKTAAFSVTEIPADGMCLSSFVLLTDASDSLRVLMGRLDPAAPWDRIGALDPERVQKNATGWMLPSCHLLYGEAPEAAARRILVEQLELSGDLPLRGPTVFSEVGAPARHPESRGHWDIGFLFRGSIRPEEVPRARAWRELAFVDVRRVDRAEITRSHDEVLDAAGLPPPRPTSG